MATYTQDDVNREILAATVNKSVYDWITEIDRVLSGRLDITSVINRGIFFIPSAMDARQSLVRAKKQLQEQFLPTALNAIRDKSRSLHLVKQNIADYLSALKSQYGVALKIGDTHGMTKAAKEFFEEVDRKVNDPKNIPWWGWVGVAVAGAYVLRTFKW